MKSKGADVRPSEMTMIEKFENLHGYHWLMASVFVVGDMVGGGVVGLPNALANAGLVPGIILICLCALFSGYTGLQLAWSWTMLQRRWPKYRNYCRKPYGEIAYRAFGSRMRSFIALMVCLTQFGFISVLTLLAAKNTSVLLNFFFDLRVNFCWMILIIGLVVWPVTMLKSPMHFWQVGVFSALSSSIAICLLYVGYFHDGPVCLKESNQRQFDWQHFFMAYGTMVFAFGGHCAFPTLQHDMKKPRLFGRSVWVAYTLITFYYLSIAVGGYLIYGGTVGEAVIHSIQLRWVQQTVNVMITIHVITAIVIAFSPMTQQIEELLKISESFGWQRFLVRSVLFWLLMFVALSAPNFGPLMDLVGATTMSLMTMILPSVFYLFLRASDEKRELISINVEDKESKDNVTASFAELFTYVPKTILTLNCLSLTFGIVGGVVATVFSIKELTSYEVSAPCYIQYLRNGLPFVSTSTGSVNCCGPFRNITVSGDDPEGFCARV